MNYSIKYIILSLIAVFASANASAQQQDELTKEITVETDYRPAERKVSKLNKLPVVAKSDVPKYSLKYSEWAEPVDVPALAPLMLPYGYLTSHNFSNQRGYFDFGISSLIDIAGNAGLAIVDKSETSLNLWVRHNSSWNGRNKSLNLPPALNVVPKQKFNDNIICLNLSHKFYQGTLSASLRYHYDHFNYYGGISNIADTMQTINEFRIALGWTNSPRNSALKYSASLVFNHFDFAKAMNHVDNSKGLADNRLSLLFNASNDCGNATSFGANAKIDYLSRKFHSANNLLLTNDDAQPAVHSESTALVSLSPFLHYKNDKINAKAGINVDISFNDGTALRFSPDIRLNCSLTDGLNFFLDARGGKRLTALCDMFATNRYINPSASLSNSYTPIDAEAGFKIGMFAGFHAKLFAGYGVFKDMPLPTADYTDLTANFATTYLPFDVKGWKAGVELGYKFHYAEAEFAVTYAPQEVDKGYLLGPDRAKCVATASVTVNPVAGLKVTAGYELRAKRSVAMPAVAVSDNSLAPISESYQLCDIGNVCNLSLSASYQISKMLGFFISADNLLDRRWDNFYMMGAQPLSLLAGVSLIF